MFKDGEPVALTREGAIKLHREMWRDMVEAEKKHIEHFGSKLFFDRRHFKEIWVATHGFSDVYADCFLCEYTKHFEGTQCSLCPINWGGTVEELGEQRTCIDDPVDEHGASIDFSYLHEKSGYFETSNQLHWLYSPIEKVANAPLKEEISDDNKGDK